jgi:hypothetical protein
LTETSIIIGAKKAEPKSGASSNDKSKEVSHLVLEEIKKIQKNTEKHKVTKNGTSPVLRYVKLQNRTDAKKV